MAQQKDTSTEITVTISQAKKIMEKVVAKKDSHSPIYLHSSPGIGKSAIVRQICDELGWEMVDLRLSMLEPSDVGGIPYVSGEEMHFSTPTWFPTDPESKGILFVDELSNANISTQHAAYRVIHDRSVNNGKKLPAGWKIIAAGNLKSDKTGAKDVAPALANRFGTHLNIRPDLQDFIAYAVRGGINEQIIGFLNFRKDALYRFDPAKNEMAFATPRSWEQASNLMEMGLDSTDLDVALSGCVGQGSAMEFAAFRKYYSKLPDFDKIMDGEEEYTIPKSDVGLVFAVTSSLIFALIENHDNKVRMENLLKKGGLIEQLDDDFKILLYKSLSRGTDRHTYLSIVKQTKDHFKKLMKYIPD